MTPERWRRQRDAQRLLNYNIARLAEDAAQQAEPVRAPDHETTGPRFEFIAIDEASELTPEFIAEFGRVTQARMERDLELDFAAMMAGPGHIISVDPAREPDLLEVQQLPAGGFRYRRGRPTTGREILDRERAQRIGRNLRNGQWGRPERPQVYGPPDPQDVEAKYYKDHLAGVRDDVAMFDRWFDILDSQGELEDFLWKCFAYGKQFKRKGNLTVKSLEAKG